MSTTGNSSSISRCLHNDLRARYFTRASGTLAPTAVEGGSRYRDRAMGRGLMLATTEWTMDINAACARLAIRTRALAVS